MQGTPHIIPNTQNVSSITDQQIQLIRNTIQLNQSLNYVPQFPPTNFIWANPNTIVNTSSTLPTNSNIIVNSPSPILNHSINTINPHAPFISHPLNIKTGLAQPIQTNSHLSNQAAVESRKVRSRELEVLLLEALEQDCFDETGLQWLQGDNYKFVLSWPLFKRLYERESSATKDSIRKVLKNRGFDQIKLYEQKIPEKLKNHQCEVWEHTRPVRGLPPIRRGMPLQLVNPLKGSVVIDKGLCDTFAEEILSDLKGDSIPIRTLISRMKPKFQMTGVDAHNLEIFLKPYATSADLIIWKDLRNFLVRFGPLNLSIQKIRDFVDSGASSWYHGPTIDRVKAHNKLMELFNHEQKEYYLVRDSSNIEKGRDLNEETLYVFAVDYISSTFDFKPQSHRLFFDSNLKLCIPLVVENEDGSSTIQKKTFSNIAEYISQQLKLKNPKSVPSGFYTNLKENTGEVFVSVLAQNIKTEVDTSPYLKHMQNKQTCSPPLTPEFSLRDSLNTNETENNSATNQQNQTNYFSVDNFINNSNENPANNFTNQNTTKPPPPKPSNTDNNNDLFTFGSNLDNTSDPFSDFL